VFDDQTFQRLVEADQLTGEVVASNSFIIEVKGLEGVRWYPGVVRGWPAWAGPRSLRRQGHLFNIDSEKMERER